jgi:hypothetical protein
MKKKILKEDLQTYVRHLDKRCERFDISIIDQIIEDGFPVVNESAPIFFDESTIDVTDYINNGVVKMSYDVDADVIYIYDAFLSYDSQNPIESSDNKINIDARVTGRVNIDFSSTTDMYDDYTFHHTLNSVGTEAKTLVVRYAYIPSIEFEELFLTRDEFKALRSGIAVACFDYLQEEAKVSGHRASLDRAVKAIVDKEPGDFYDSLSLRKFIYGS